MVTQAQVATEGDDNESSSPGPKRKPEGTWPFARAQYFGGDWPSPVSCPSHTLQSQKIIYLGKGKVGKKEGRDGKEEEREGGSFPPHLLHLRQVSATKHRGLSSSFRDLLFTCFVVPSGIAF